LFFATPRTVAHQASLSRGFPRQKSWSWLPFPSSGIFPTNRSSPCLLLGRQILYHRVIAYKIIYKQTHFNLVIFYFLTLFTWYIFDFSLWILSMVRSKTIIHNHYDIKFLCINIIFFILLFILISCLLWGFIKNNSYFKIYEHMFSRSSCAIDLFDIVTRFIFRVCSSWALQYNIKLPKVVVSILVSF